MSDDTIERHPEPTAPGIDPALAAALVAAQAELRNVAPDAEARVRMKSGGEFSYRYATLGSILAMARPVLGKHGLAIVQTPVARDGRVGVRTQVLHASGATLESELLLSVESDTPQAFGSAVSYSRRYSLTSLLGIASDEDDDAAAAQPKEAAPSQRGAKRAEAKRKPEPEPESADGERLISDAQRRKLWAEATAAGEAAGLDRSDIEATLRGVLAKRGIEHSRSLPAADFDDVLGELEHALSAGPFA